MDRKLAALKADKYIGRDGGAPQSADLNKDVATVARALSGLPPFLRADALAALARVSGLPVGAVRLMMNDCPF